MEVEGLCRNFKDDASKNSLYKMDAYGTFCITREHRMVDLGSTSILALGGAKPCDDGGAFFGFDVGYIRGRHRVGDASL